MASLPELEPRTERSNDGLENAELRVKWLQSQQSRFTEEGYRLALDAMQGTVEQYRMQAAQPTEENVDINPLQTS
jgi:hypothetical protein